MEPENDHYHISFFKPTTDSARRNRNIVVQLVLIWVVAIFGFQILLKVLEKPVPEKAYEEFLPAWAKMEAGNATMVDKQNVAKSALSVLGKVAIDSVHRVRLDMVVSYLIFDLADSAQKIRIDRNLMALEDMKSQFAQQGLPLDITDRDYIAAKIGLIPLIYEILDLDADDVRGKIAPVEISSKYLYSLENESRTQLAGIMEFYLTHTQSALTQARFLGFPFHYFYTAVFLLILFVFLCWLYCYRTDQFNKKYGIED